jgi:acidic protein MsyB
VSIYSFFRRLAMPKDSMFYATLEEAIDAAREEFSPIILIATKRAPTLSSSIFKSMCCRMAIYRLAGRIFADEDEQGECRCCGEAAQSVFDGDYDDRAASGVAGRKYAA